MYPNGRCKIENLVCSESLCRCPYRLQVPYPPGLHLMVSAAADQIMSLGEKAVGQ